MARMTGVVPALYQTLGTQLAEKRRAQEIERERLRRKGELLKAFGAMGFQDIPPEGVSEDTAPYIVQQKLAQQSQDAQMARIKEDNEAQIRLEIQKKVDADDKKRIEFEADRDGVLKYYPDFEKEFFPINSQNALKMAQEFIGQNLNLIIDRKRDKEQTDENIRQWGETRPTPSPRPTSVSQLNYNQRMLARKYRDFITEREYGVDYTNPEKVYDALPPEIQDQWDAEQAAQTGRTGTPTPSTSPTQGGGMPAFMQPGFLPPSIDKTQTSPNQSPQGGKVIGTDRNSGKKIYQLPNGKYVDEDGNEVEVR